MPSDQSLATAFNTLAHPRRVRLFRLLIEHPELGASVGTLQQVTGYQKAALLHHLRILENAGLLTRRRTANATVQVLRTGPLTAAMDAVRQLTGETEPAKRSAA